MRSVKCVKLVVLQLWLGGFLCLEWNLDRIAGKIRWITGLQTQKKNRGQMALLREGFSAGIAEDVLEGAGAEAMRNTNIWFINALPFPLPIIRNVSGR